MTAANALTDTILQLRHDPQAAARAVAAAGQRVVGYVGDDVPVALILAADAHPVRLRVRGNPAGADRFVESSFTPQVREIAGQWLTGALDHVDSVVFARSDDSGQRLYYYLCELQRTGLCGGPRPLLYDIASLPRSVSFEHTLESTRLLSGQLGASSSRLPHALERVRERAELLDAVRAKRRLPAPLAGSSAWSLEYAAGCDWRRGFDDAARAWLDAAPPLPGPKRVLLAGDPLPDERIHTAVESVGASIVFELTSSTTPAAPAQRDPLAAIAEECQRRESPALSMRRSARWIADAALEHRADVVLLWLSEQNEALPWEIPRQVASLRAAGIPALLLARQSADTPAAVLDDVQRFVRTAGESR